MRLEHRRIRILIVISQLDIGGAELHLARVLPKLQSRSFEVTVIALRTGCSLDPVLRASGVKVYSVDLGKFHAFGVLKRLLILRRHARLVRPHIFHFFLPKAYLLGSLATFGMRGWRVMSRRSLATYQQARSWVRLSEGLCHKSVDIALGNSNAVVSQLTAEGIPLRRLGLLRNGVEEARSFVDRVVLRRHLGHDSVDLIIVCVANFFPYKGHTDLIRALSAIGPLLSVEWKILMIGRDEGIGAHLREMVREFELEPHVEWTGSVADVAPYLAAADLFVLPSHEEGFSNALLEAMMAGLPIVATAVGGNLDAIRDGTDGLLVPPHSPEQLGGALLTLASDPALRKRLGQSAKARAIEHFSLEACVDKYADLYAGLVEGRYPPLPLALRPDGDHLTCAE